MFPEATRQRRGVGDLVDIVGQDVEPAMVSINLFEERSDLLVIVVVNPAGDAFTTESGHVGSGSLHGEGCWGIGIRFAAPGNVDGSAAFSEALGDTFANATTAAGYDCNFAR